MMMLVTLFCIPFNKKLGFDWVHILNLHFAKNCIQLSSCSSEDSQPQNLYRNSDFKKAVEVSASTCME